MVFPEDDDVKQCKKMELFNKSQLSSNLLSTFAMTLDCGKLQDLIKTF